MFFFGGAINSLEDDNLTLEKNDFQNNTSTIGDSEVFKVAASYYGTEDGDDLMGTPEDDLLNGLEGNDTLAGLEGDDVLIGGTGDDVFVLAAGEGTDGIIDFADGEDLIGLSAGTSYEDLTLVGDKISLNGQTLAIVSGIDTATLTGDDFTPGEFSL